MLRRLGETINPKRVWRIWQVEGLVLPRKRPRKRRRAQPGGLPTRATRRGHVWAYDFVFDRTERGRVPKMLIVFAEHGAPAYLRRDNGGEFIADAVRAWLARRGTTTVHIEPGHPWENGVVESFHGKLRDECRNQEVFWGEAHAQVIVERWRRRDNEERPHRALGYRTPAEVAQGLPTSNARTSDLGDDQTS